VSIPSNSKLFLHFGGLTTSQGRSLAVPVVAEKGEIRGKFDKVTET